MLSDDELRRLMGDQESLPKASMLNPAKIWVESEILAELVRASLLKSPAPTGDSQTQETRQRLVDFLGWLSQQSGELEIALYPAADDGLDDLDLPGGSDSDPSEDLPF